MKGVLAIILGGGSGQRLYPLTKQRAKPAVPWAGKYRLIDIPINNCIQSDIYKVYILTQFNSASLNRYVSQTYAFGGPTQGFIEILAAQKTPQNPGWFRGTADAVRQYLWLLQQHEDIKEFLILPSTHLYRMDYSTVIHKHREIGADISISVLPMVGDYASFFDVVKTDREGQVIDFLGKNQHPDWEDVGISSATTELRLSCEFTHQTKYLASMGIYIFNRDVLFNILEGNETAIDFSQDVIPSALKKFRTQSCQFRGYWKDIGTIRSFYHANLDFAEQSHALFDIYKDDKTIYTQDEFLPPSHILNCRVTESMIAEGCIIENCRINHSVIGVQSKISSGCVIEHSLIMGTDRPEPSDQLTENYALNLAVPNIGKNCLISNAILDKNIHIGNDVQIINKDQIEYADREELGFCIRDGIVVVLKNSLIDDGTVI